MPRHQARAQLQVREGSPRRRERRDEGLPRAVREDAPPRAAGRRREAVDVQGVRRKGAGGRDTEACARGARSRLPLERHRGPLQEPLPVDRRADDARAHEDSVQDNLRRWGLRADPREGRPLVPQASREPRGRAELPQVRDAPSGRRRGRGEEAVDEAREVVRSEERRLARRVRRCDRREGEDGMASAQEVLRVRGRAS